MDKKIIEEKCQEVVKKIQAKLAGWDKEIDLHKETENKDERIAKLESEVKAWKEKFDAMWSAWHTLAINTVGKEEAAKMAEGLKNGA